MGGIGASAGNGCRGGQRILRARRKRCRNRGHQPSATHQSAPAVGEPPMLQPVCQSVRKTAPDRLPKFGPRSSHARLAHPHKRTLAEKTAADRLAGRRCSIRLACKAAGMRYRVGEEARCDSPNRPIADSCLNRIASKHRRRFGPVRGSGRAPDRDPAEFV